MATKRDNHFFTLTSKAGRFIFPTETRLSHAKLVRDTITASFMGHLPDEDEPVRKSRHVAAWLIRNLNGPAAHNSFDWVRA